MSTLDDILQEQRAGIIAREEATFRKMLAAYDDIQREIKKSIRELRDKMTAAKMTGEEISLGWFKKERRLEIFLSQVQEQVVRYGGKAKQLIEREQEAAIRIAVDHAGDSLKLTASLTGPEATARVIGAQLNTKAIENAVGLMGDGSPLRAYFKESLPAAVSAAINREIVKAVALGTDFNTVARRLETAGDISRWRALTTARTEVNRVRRETTRQIYTENKDIVSGWEWCCSKSTRTCVVCLSLDGKVFKLEDPFPHHPQCRCTMLPVIDGVQRRPRVIGTDWFDRQPDHVKEEMLGDAEFDAYQNGKVDLKDFVGWKTDLGFGKSVYHKKLPDILKEK
jgi:SPP1 gp7 family putative phage head morphogenesis protein